MTRLTPAALVALMVLASPAFAQPPGLAGGPPAPGAQDAPPMPANVGELDAALAARDYARLEALHGELHTVDQALPFMSWERARLLDGGGLYLSQLYMNDLWRLAKAVPPTEPTAATEVAGLQGASVLMGLYSYALIALDGTKCADAAAPGRWADQLAQAPVWAHAGDIPAAERGKMIDAVLALESQTASRRGRDDLICRGAKAAPGPARSDAQAGPGVAGSHFALPPPADPSLFVDLMVWGPRQAKLRAGLHTELAKLVKLDAPKPNGKR